MNAEPLVLGDQEQDRARIEGAAQGNGGDGASVVAKAGRAIRVLLADWPERIVIDGEYVVLRVILMAAHS